MPNVTRAIQWLSAAVAVVFAMPACYAGKTGSTAPHPRVASAQAAAKQAIAAEAQLRPDSLPVRTVGVLPFDQTGLDSSTADLGYGLADLLRVDLAKSRQLRIVDRLRLDAIMQELALARSGRTDSSAAPRVGRLVQARHMVYGALALRGSAMGLSVGVADASTRQVRPALSTQTRLNDVLDAEKQVALRLFDNLGVTLTPAERASVEERPTKNIAAFIAYGRGARYSTEFRFADAVREFDRAVQLDPSFELAAMRRDEAAALAGLTTRRNALARASNMTVDRLNGVFTTPIGGSHPVGGITDPVFPALTITIFITILTPPR